jgi:hypothetical protein
VFGCCDKMGCWIAPTVKDKPARSDFVFLGTPREKLKRRMKGSGCDRPRDRRLVLIGTGGVVAENAVRGSSR